MSHYTVTVIHKDTQDVDELLAPYDEEIKVAPYIKYTKQEAIEYVRKKWKGYEDKSDSECYDAFAEDYISEGMTDEDGNLYSTYNPNSKWDWYQKGGRWSGLLKTKDGEKCNEAYIKDLDFSVDQEVYRRALRFWDVHVDHAPLEPGEQESDFWTLYNEKFFRDYYLNRENYARIRSSFSTYAVITPNGVWHSKGEMGWWGCSSETPEESIAWDNAFMERFINHADPDLMITIVDCHV